MSAPLAFLQSIGLPELLLILAILVLLFGVRKLPDLGRGLGEGIRNFRDSMKEGQSGNGSDGSSGSASKDDRR